MTSAGPFYTDSECPLDLGFLEPCEPWMLQSRFFPSKFGGKPAWLDLKHLPPMSDLRCGEECEEPLSFLCQVYAPVETNPQAFHRTIFIFVCKKPSCQKFKALRCQMGRENSFYSFDAPVENPEWMPEIRAETYGCRVCRACGCGVDGPGGKCGGCKKVDYCHRLCQVADWKHRHKLECKKEDFDPLKTDDDKAGLQKGLLGGRLFPEYEIVMAGDDSPEIPEDDDDNDDQEGDDNSEDEGSDVEASEMENFRQLEKEGKTGEMTAADLAQFDAKGLAQDKTLKRFQKAIKSAPDQVVRYNRGKRPLWVSSENVPSPEQIPNCELCSGPRTFEFQIMPQALTYLKLDKGVGVDSLDWGTLAVYTCQESCCSQEEPAYKTEFIWRQPMS